MPQPPKKQAPARQAPADQLVSELNRLLGGYGYKAQREPQRDELGYISPARQRAMDLLQENERSPNPRPESSPGSYADNPIVRMVSALYGEPGKLTGEDRQKQDELYAAYQLVRNLRHARRQQGLIPQAKIRYP